MNLLPIVTRELRVASRRKGTYWIRWTAAGLAIVVTVMLLLVTQLSAPLMGGDRIFQIVVFYTFALCLLSGVFLTADCLSEEKRAGTMGLFFLTDLKGYDVVLGKLMATSLNAFYGLFALVPILALPLLIGGVTAAEFWRTILALLNAMFFSLAVGLWISAQSNSSQRAMMATLGCLGVFVVALPSLHQLVKGMQWAGALTLANPLSLLLLSSETAFAGDASKYLISLAGCQSVAWLLLLRASMTLPRSWQEGGERKSFSYRASQFAAEGRDGKRREEFLERNPILWLMSTRRHLSWFVWGLAILAAGISVISAIYGGAAMAMVTSWFLWPILLLLKLVVAFRATLFFTEARNSGALELVVSTPLTSGEIVRGQLLAMERLFARPVILIAISMLAPVVMAVFSDTPLANWGFMGAMTFYGAVRFIANVVAIAWFGMWIALTCRKPASATAWTVLFAVILPALALCVPSIAIDMFLLIWARSRLSKDIRTLPTVQTPR